MIPPPPTSTLFPYTTLFRSCLVISAISAVIGITLANTIRPGDRIDPATAAAIEQRYATDATTDRKSTRLNSSHSQISYAVFCLKKKKKRIIIITVQKKYYSI